MKNILRDPLVHFILAAGLMFTAYTVLTARYASTEHTIFVSTSEMERMAALYASEAGTLPSADDMQAMVIDHVQQQALVREARRLGLDDGDIVVDRRLAQKMTFMIADMAEVPVPDEATLQAWLERYPERFETPARISFQHVFFADAQDARMLATLQELQDAGGDAWRAQGDPFILQREYADLPRRELIRLFGVDMASTLLSQEHALGTWFGPVRSAYGAHLINIVGQADSQRPTLDAVRSAVEADWRDAQARRLNAEAIADIVAKYDVVIEADET